MSDRRWMLALAAVALLFAPGSRASLAGHVAPAASRHGAAAAIPALIHPCVTPGAAFVMREPLATAFFTDRGVALSLARPKHPHSTRRGLPDLDAWGLHWTPVGARSVAPRPEAPIEARVNYLVGADPERWKTNLGAWSRLVYEAIRPGIDLMVEPRVHGLKYTVRAEAGIDASTIGFRVDGARQVKIQNGGQALEIETGVGVVRETGLVCYQPLADGRRRALRARYAGVQRATGPLCWEYAIALTGVDPRLPVVIDPTLSWGTYVGGSFGDEGAAIAVDAAENVYVAGYTLSADFPVPGAFDPTLEDADAFVTKIDASGTSIIWSSYLGGSSLDAGSGITVDAAGDVYVTGVTYSTDFPTPGAFDPTLGDFLDAFVTKIDATGAGLVWSSYLGGSSDDYGAAIAVDGAGAAYVTGYTMSSDLATPGAFQTSFGGDNDAFVTKVNASGSSIEWSTYLGGLGWDEGAAIAVNGTGDVYVGGTTSSLDFPTTSGALDESLGGAADGFVTKIDASGASLEWSTFLGGYANEGVRGIAVDGAGNAYVAGYVWADPAFPSDFPILGAFDTTHNGGFDALVTKFNPSGGLVWSSFLGGTDNDYGNAIAVDTAGNVYVTGHTFSSDFPTLAAFDSEFNDGSPDPFEFPVDAFVTKVDASGATLAWSSYLGGSGEDRGWGIAWTPGGVYVGGITTSADFPASGAFDSTYNGNTDTFIVRLLDDASAIPVPASLIQSAVPGGPAQPPGFVDSDQTVSMRANVAGGSAPRLEVEVKTNGAAFDGTGLISGNVVAASGGVSEVTAGPLAWGAYHWRARTTDATGTSSAWVVFDPAVGADFTLTLTPGGGPPPPGAGRTRTHRLCGGSAAAQASAWPALACALFVLSHCLCRRARR